MPSYSPTAVTSRLSQKTITTPPHAHLDLSLAFPDREKILSPGHSGAVWNSCPFIPVYEPAHIAGTPGRQALSSLMFSVLPAASLGRQKTTLFQFTDEKGASHSLQVKLTHLGMPVTSVPSCLLSLCDVEHVAPEERLMRTSCVTVQLWKHRRAMIPVTSAAKEWNQGH